MKILDNVKGEYYLKITFLGTASAHSVHYRFVIAKSVTYQEN